VDAGTTIKPTFDYTIDKDDNWNDSVPDIINIPADQNVTVTNGATLTINPGKTINFGQNSCLIVEQGSMVRANGLSNNKINFNFSGQTGGISLYHYSEFSHVNISNANTGIYISGINGLNEYFPNISQVNFINNNIGIKLYNSIASNNDSLSWCKFQDNDDYGIYLENSYLNITGVQNSNYEIDNSNIGVILCGSSELKSSRYQYSYATCRATCLSQA